jgi:hypothetical protein
MYTAMSLADVHKFSVYQLTGKIIIRFVLKTVQFNPKRKIMAMKTMYKEQSMLF